MLESLFNEVTGLQACNFIEKRLQRRHFPVNITKYLRTPYRTPLVAAFELTSYNSLETLFMFKVSDANVSKYYCFSPTTICLNLPR